MEVWLTGKLAENTFQSKLKDIILRGYGGKHNPAGSLPKICLLCPFLMSGIYQMPGAVMCLPWLQVPGTLRLFWAQDKQRDYIDEWISTRLPWQWDRAGFSSSGFIKQCLVQQCTVWMVAGEMREMRRWLVTHLNRVTIITIRMMFNTFIGHLWWILITFSGPSS